MTIGQYYELEELKQRKKEIQYCINRCQKLGNIEGEILLRDYYMKPVEQKIKQIRTNL